MGHFVTYQTFKKDESAKTIGRARDEVFRRNGGEVSTEG